MSRGIYVALSGAIAQENALETTATNLANTSSPGFQRLRPVFQEALANAGKKPDGSLHYASVATATLDTTAGPVRTTNRALDVAPADGTYLVVDAGRGQRYTRAGSLTLDPSGTLVTTGGAKVLGDGGASISAATGGGEVSIEPNGNVKQGGQSIGKLSIVKLERPERMTPEGNGLYAVGDAGRADPADAPLTVGALAESNAQPVTAMTELMSASRTFEAFQRALETLGEVDRKVLTAIPGAFE